MEMQRARTVKKILKENKVGGPILPYFDTILQNPRQCGTGLRTNKQNQVDHSNSPLDP